MVVKALTDGKKAEGFSRLDRLGWIHKPPDEERYKRLAADYVDSVSKERQRLS